ALDRSGSSGVLRRHLMPRRTSLVGRCTSRHRTGQNLVELADLALERDPVGEERIGEGVVPRASGLEDLLAEASELTLDLPLRQPESPQTKPLFRALLTREAHGQTPRKPRPHGRPLDPLDEARPVEHPAPEEHLRRLAKNGRKSGVRQKVREELGLRLLEERGQVEDHPDELGLEGGRLVGRLLAGGRRARRTLAEAGEARLRAAAELAPDGADVADAEALRDALLVELALDGAVDAGEHRRERGDRAAASRGIVAGLTGRDVHEEIDDGRRRRELLLERRHALP